MVTCSVSPPPVPLPGEQEKRHKPQKPGPWAGFQPRTEHALSRGCNVRTRPGAWHHQDRLKRSVPVGQGKD